MISEGALRAGVEVLRMLDGQPTPVGDEELVEAIASAIQRSDPDWATVMVWQIEQERDLARRWAARLEGELAVSEARLEELLRLTRELTSLVGEALDEAGVP